MHNKIITTLLGLFAAAFAVASDYAETGEVYRERADEIAAFAASGLSFDALYDGYSINDYIESYADYEKPSKSLFGKKTLLEMTVVNQHPDLPCGCEIASAVSLIGYNGYKVPLTTFADDFITYDTEFYHDKDGVLWGPDPTKIFVGDPFGWGYGCYPPVLADSINRYFTAVGAGHTAHPATGLSETELEALVAGGVPVIVWATLDMVQFDYRDPSVWLLKDSGEEFLWYKNSHTLVLCGFDEDAFYFMDPNDKETITAYGRDLFMTRYSEAGAKAVLVKRSRIGNRFQQKRQLA
jgi:uncharacterized protein YvpB